MGRAIGTVASVTPWEAAAVLGWWCLILAAPVMLLRRQRRRGKRSRRSRSEDGQRRTADAIMATPIQHAKTSDPPRLASGTIESLCRYVDFHRRLGHAVSELEERLAALPRERWRIGPYPLIGERRNTVLVMGERGVFMISATYAPGHFDEVITVSRLAMKIQMLLPGYPGQVAARSAFRSRRCGRASGTAPTVAANGAGRGGGGGDSLIEWLGHFDRGARPIHGRSRPLR